MMKICWYNNCAAEKFGICLIENFSFLFTLYLVTDSIFLENLTLCLANFTFYFIDILKVDLEIIL
jgi:hypothetical protein